MQSGPQRDLGMEKTDNGKSDWETGQAGAQCHSWELTTQRHGAKQVPTIWLHPKGARSPETVLLQTLERHCRHDSEESFNFYKSTDGNVYL